MKQYIYLYDPNLTLSERILKQSLLAVTVISFYCFILYGFIIKPNLGAPINSFISFIIFFILFLTSEDKKKHPFIRMFFTFYCLIALSFNWVFTNGIDGGTGYLYLLLIGFYAIASPSKYYLHFLFLIFINVILLFFIEFYWPNVIHQDLSEQHLLFCSISNLLVSLIVTAIGLLLVKVEYEKERQNVQEKKQYLIAANNARSRFLANISHEIRTPLNGVMGMAALLENSNPTTEQKEYVQTIKISSNRLLKIINEILDYSKAEAGKTELRIDPFSLIQCVEDAININHPKALEKELSLNYHIERNIPNILSGDGGKLQQILINLLGNAIKFTHQGNIHLYIQRINKVDQKITLEFSIKDTGIGIPQDSLSKLFDAFTQVDDSRTRTNSGTGLGLAISKRFVELMQGNIWVESTEKEGSTFYFTAKFDVLPNQSKLPSPIDTAIITPRTTVPNNLSILLVEDDKINRMLAIRLLEKMGYTVHSVTNGQEAINALKEGQFNFVLMDVQMPVMDGLEATRIIRQELDKQPIIIAMTANAMIEDQRLCEEAGMDDFLAKPINVKALEAILFKWKKTTIY
ncbi:ATP-binding protein [Aureispira anguillae]|uniref:histidine kinase n=1 Tax=Aureispira anguillae TaxID=2864201 RepID=A0A915VKF1_9BACT|nr:ATP-binding protein [Aureispira anguillae]BDS09634.1 ATP-binding protein [Aureispira anguillae]